MYGRLSGWTASATAQDRGRHRLRIREGRIAVARGRSARELLPAHQRPHARLRSKRARASDDSIPRIEPRAAPPITSLG